MLRIRLQRFGTKNEPTYRLVVAEQSIRRDGRFVEVLGNYNPRARGKTPGLTIDVARVDHWIKLGAQPSDLDETAVAADALLGDDETVGRLVFGAIERDLIRFKAHDLRGYSKDKHRKVDDMPYGGGPGMLMTCQPLFDAVDALATPGCEVIYLCPDGEQLTNPLARELAQKEHLILISGHYEGIDQRFRDRKVTREISIGDYVLTNGTLPACVLVDCIGRQIPGVLGEENSLTGDSYNGKLLAFPQFTRPAVYDGLEVPPVLLGGNHAEIERWRRERQIEKTRKRRPDLLKDQEKQP